VNIPATYQELVKKEIEQFCKQLKQSPHELYEPMRYMLTMEGKKLRPILLLLSCKTFKGNLKHALPVAVAVEVFHSFTLMHDDITDNAPLRRNKPSVHVKWNTNIALLSGDAMMVKAYECIAKAPASYLSEILSLFNDTALKVCEGQQLDMNFETQEKVSIKDYLHMISLKTAALFSASLEMGAILAGASKKDSDRMKVFGENIGLLFQLQDDVLDVFGSQEKVGKQTGGDIIQNKKTFLLLKALELAKGKDLQELKSLLKKSGISSREKVKRVTAIYQKVGVLDHASTHMMDYYLKALKAIERIKSPELKILVNLVDGMMSREI
jgi:geranylgeranyl diphosphate synthase type II